jgi:hypothetical protein
MTKTLRFVIATVFTLNFWYMFLACFTIFWMMAWRTALRDVIFKSALPKSRRY